MSNLLKSKFLADWAYLRAVSGGNAARRAPEVVLALVAPRAFLDPALGFTRQVILSWAKRVAMDPTLVEWVTQAWAREVDQPSLPGKPRGPIAWIVTQLRRLGWEPTEPGLWHQGAEPRSVFDFEGLRNRLDQALAFSRWEALLSRRRDFAGAEDSIDEEASFREPVKAFDARRHTTFGRYACILSEAHGPGTVTPELGSTWTPVVPCVRIPGRPQCTCGGCAPGGSFLRAQRAGNWPSLGPQLVGSPGACGSAGSCPRRSPATAPPAARDSTGILWLDN